MNTTVLTAADAQAYANTLAERYLRNIVSRHVEERRGNGHCPTEPMPHLIRPLYDQGMRVKDVAKACNVELRVVMETLDEPWFCEICGRTIDLDNWQGGYYAVGDDERPFRATGPHGENLLACNGGGYFINKFGNEYLGDSPEREDY